MSAPFAEAGPSRLSLPALRRGRPGRRSSPSLPSSPHLIADDDEEVSRVDSVDAVLDSSSEPLCSFGIGIIPSSASHRFVPFSLRPMASEMVRPPEVGRTTPAGVVAPSL